MKITNKCVCCGSYNIKKQPGIIADFIAYRVFGYEKAYCTHDGVTYPLPLRCNVILCSDCNYTGSDMRFDEDELNNIYKDYRAESYKFDRGVFESAYASINDLLGKSAIEVAERVKNLSTLIHDYLDIKNLKTIIDYGGDSGQFIPRELLNSKCYLYDPSSSVPMENIIKIQEAAKLPHADFIMCCHTLEHVSYPLELLNAIATLLNPNGYIYIEVPLEVPDLPALSFDHISKYVHEHINAFTTKSIAALISNANIKLTPITIQIKKIKTESFGVTNIISVICQKSL